MLLLLDQEKKFVEFGNLTGTDWEAGNKDKDDLGQWGGGGKRGMKMGGNPHTAGIMVGDVERGGTPFPYPR